MHTSPESIKNEIVRNSLIDGLSFQIESNAVVIVSGKTNVGKSTLLAQFHKRHEANSLSVFISGASSWGYDFEMITNDLCDQVRALTGWKGRITNFELETATSNWQLALAELSKWARHAKRTVNFIVDGLDEIPDSAESTALAIFKLLPIGLTPFKFILSGARALKLVRDVKTKGYGEFVVTDFTEEETKRYLSDILPPETASEVYTLSRGLPGYCATVRRVFEAQGTIQSPLPDTLPKFFEYEWTKVASREDLEQLVAFICFDKQPPTKARLSSLMNCTPEHIGAITGSISFLILKDDMVTFATDSFRPFAARKVAHLQKSTIEKIIENFFLNSLSEESVRHLPDLLAQAGRHQQVIQYLNDEYIIAALKQKKAARFIQERTIIGLRAAAQDERTEEVIRYGLQGANLDALYLDEHWSARINAYVSIGQEETALGIARSFTTPEDRIQGLCAVAIHQKKKKGQAADSVMEEISRENAQLDKEHLGKRAYDIAADLVYIAPKLALDLIQNITRGEVAPKENNYVAGPRPNQPTATDDPEKCAASALEILSNRITDPTLRSFSRALSATSRGQTSEQVISEVDTLSTDEEKRYYLRIWLSENRSHANRAAVIKYALDFLRSSKTVTPTPGFALEIVRASRNLQEAPEVIRAIRDICPVLKRLGPTADYYRLMLYLCEASSSKENNSNAKEFEAIIKETATLPDLALRAFIAAEILLVLVRLKDREISWINKQHHQDATTILDASTESILTTTADHYQCLRRAISTLSRFDCQKAHDIIERINIEPRRDRAFADLLYSATVHRARATDINLLHKSFNAISDSNSKARCLLTVLDGLLSRKLKTDLYNIPSIAAWCDQLDDPIAAAHAQSLFSLVLIKYTNKTLAETRWLREKSATSIKLIINPIDRVSALYRLAFTFADYDRDVALSFLQQAEVTQGSLFIKTRSIEHCLLLNAHVCVRAFSGLIRQKAFNTLQFNKLTSLIEKLPDPTWQISIFSELAVRFALADDLVGCRDVVRQFIGPLLTNLPPDLPKVREEATVTASPALYAANPVSCLSTIEGLAPRSREDAVHRILKMIISKLSPDEPEEDRMTLPPDTTTSQIDEILRLVAYMEDDCLISGMLEVVTIHLTSGRSRSTRAEVEQLRAKIEQLIGAKLPSQRFKAHNGYVLLANGFVLALRNVKRPDWASLIDQVRKLPNISDRCFILATFAKIQGPKLLDLRRELLQESIELADKIPVQYDRTDRLTFVAEIAKSIDSSLFGAALKRVLETPREGEVDDRSLEIKRRAIDLAYFQNETLANSFVSALDDEPARDVRTMLQKRLEFLQLQKRILERNTSGLDLKNKEEIPSIFFRNLRRLNSGLVIPPNFRSLAPLFLAVEGRPIDEIFPILSFGIESCVRNYAGTQEAFGILTKIFNVCLDSSKVLMHCLAHQSEGAPVTPAHSTRGETSQNSIIIRKSEKALACDFIRNKLGSASASRVYIIDPYFAATELDLAELVSSLCPESQIIVMTSKKWIEEKYGAESARHAFKEAWKTPGKDSADLRIFVVGFKGTGEPPIHERMILCDSLGIKLGGSWNGIGGEKETDLRVLDKDETRAWRESAEQFTLYMQHIYRGATVDYDVFSL